jgi:RES domain-containing protein
VTHIIWRIEKTKYAAVASKGDGARIAGGRWTSPGLPAIYCAEHLSLAILEVLVHAPDPNQREVPRIRFRIRLDRALIEGVPEKQIPPDFSPRTPYAVTRAFGDAWLLSERRPALSVPSAIVPMERNFILNPRHPDFAKISWGEGEPINLDHRLWNTGRLVR